MKCLFRNRIVTLLMVGVIVFSSVFFTYHTSLEVDAFTGIEEGIVISTLLSMVGIVVPGMDSQKMVDWWQDPTNDVAQYVKTEWTTKWQEEYQAGIGSTEGLTEEWGDYCKDFFKTASDGITGSTKLKNGVWDFVKSYASDIYKKLTASPNVPGLDFGYDEFVKAVLAQKVGTKVSSSIFSGKPVSYYFEFTHNTPAGVIFPLSDGTYKVVLPYVGGFKGFVFNDGYLQSLHQYENGSYSLNRMDMTLKVNSDLSVPYITQESDYMKLYKDDLYNGTAYIFGSSVYNSLKDYLADNNIDDWNADVSKYYDIMGTFGELKDAMLGLNDKLDSLQLVGVNSATGETSDTITVTDAALQAYLAGDITYAQYLEMIGSKVIDATDNTIVDDDPNIDGKPVVPDGAGLIADLKKFFPFCIPFDLIHAVKIFNREPSAPKIDIPINIKFINFHYTLTIDLKVYDSVAAVCRTMFLILFIIGLIFATRPLIKG